jgi:hypothetical protein
MFATALTTVTGLFSTRFLRNSFFLAFAFVLLAAVVVESGRGRLAATLSTLDGWSTVEKLLGTIALLGTVWLFAVMLESQSRTITQWFEGYWPNSFLKTAREKRYKRQLTDLRKSARMSEVYWRFPLSGNAVMPTRLGNILRASEVYPQDRYGAPALYLWPRLYPLLPEGVVTVIGDSRAALDFLLVLAALATAFTFGSAIYLFVVAAPIALYLACVLGGSAIAALAYRASLATARTYTEYVRGAFDLHRFKVLEAMNLPLPADGKAERSTWQEVRRLLVQNVPLTTKFDYPPPPTTPAP